MRWLWVDGMGCTVRKRSPHIVLIESTLRENGGLRVNHDILRRWAKTRLAREGTAAADGEESMTASLLVLETAGPGPAILTPDPAISVSFASARPRRFRTALPSVLRGLFRAIRSSDVVICGSEVGYGLLLGLPIARLLRRPFIVLVHSTVDNAVGLWQPALLRGALFAAHRRVDLAVCVSPGLVEEVVANGLPADRVLVMDVGIDVDDVIRRGRAAATSTAAARSVQPAPEASRPIVVAVGRLAPQKGFDLLIRAHALARSEGADHTLRIIGEGPEHGALVALAHSLGVADSVELAGFIHDPQPWIAAADLFVLSSRYEGNGGLVLFEALAHQVPVVATDCPTGPRRLLLDGALGELVPMEDVTALADAIAAHLRDPACLQLRAQGGPARARDFDSVIAARQLWQIAEAVAAGVPFDQITVTSAAHPSRPTPPPAVVDLTPDPRASSRPLV